MTNSSRTQFTIALAFAVTAIIELGGEASTAQAQVEPKDICLVDMMRTGDVPSEAWSRALVYDDAQSALDDGCIEIGLYCPPRQRTCRHDGIEIGSMKDRALRSLELDDLGSAVQFHGAGVPAVSIVDSDAVRIEGVDAFSAEDAIAAIHIEGSSVTISGVRGREPRYSQISAQGAIGLNIVRNSRVSTYLVGILDSALAINMENRFRFDPPTLESAGLVIKGNQEIARLSGGEDGCPARDGPLMVIAGDDGPSWMNYIVDNYTGVILDRSARMEINHTVIAGNTRCPYPSCSREEGSLFSVRRAASVSAQNVVIYDNDEDPEITFRFPASGGFSGIGNGYVVHMSSCGDVEFVSSTIAWNAGEDTFSWTQQVPGIGLLLFDHSLIYHNGGKVFSRSGLGSPFCIDGTVESICSLMYENPVNSSSPTCPDMDTFVTTEPQHLEPWEADLAIELPRFPMVAGPYVPFLVEPRPYEPTPSVAEGCVPRAMPTRPFPGSRAVTWAVAPAAEDGENLDVGFHAPIPGKR